MGSKEEQNVMIIGEEEEETGAKSSDPKRSRFPYCIVWSPLPVVSWFFPCIGHIGICREDGVILDFAGPNFVCVDHFTFGAPTRYVQLTKDECCSLVDTPARGSGNDSGTARWDDALRKSTLEYQHHSYNILTCNCHSFVSNCLNKLKFKAGGWNVVNLAILMFVKGRFVSKTAAFRTYLPFVVLIILGVGVGGPTFLAYLALCVFVLIGWFVVGTYCFRNAIRV